MNSPCDILILKKYLLYDWNSNLTGHSVLFAEFGNPIPEILAGAVQIQKYFHHNTNTLSAIFTVLTLAQLVQKH